MTHRAEMSAVLTPPETPALRQHWLAGARGFEPPSCRNCVLPTPCTGRRLPPLLGSQCNAPRAPAATPRMRAKGPAAPGGRAPPTGASGKRIHGAIWHIGEAGAALPTVRLAGASGVGWTPDAPEA